MNIRQLQYAVELSKTLNVSQVAHRLGISQPALSKQILALEEELSVKLFDRSTTPMTLTAAGEHFVLEAQRLLFQEDRLLRSMEEFRKGKRGKLTIGISPFRSLYLMPQVAVRCQEQFPEVQLVLHEASSEVLRREAAEGKYDFAIVNLPVDESVLDVIPLEEDTMVLACPKALLEHLPEGKREGETIELSLCRELPFVLVSQAQELRCQFEESCVKAGFHPQVNMEVVGLATAWEMCRVGVGATLLPRQFILHSGMDERVKLFSLSPGMRSRQSVIAVRRGAYLTECARFAIRLLSES